MSQAPAKVGNGRTAPGRVHPRENSRRTRLDGERGGNGAGGAPHHLSDLINDNAALSAEMALRDRAGLRREDGNASKMQERHDAYTMRQRAGEIAVKPYRPPAPEPR
jgi:hypothetical protein